MSTTRPMTRQERVVSGRSDLAVPMSAQVCTHATRIEVRDYGVWLCVESDECSVGGTL